MIGTVVGKLTVVALIETGRHGRTWLCRCECGNEVRRQTHNLTRGEYIGCNRCTSGFIKRVNLIGQKFGRLTVEAKLYATRRGTVWGCRCDCGNLVERLTYHLKSGGNSCGICAPGHRSISDWWRQNSQIYNVWSGMKLRCADTLNPHYGGKGIELYSEWYDFMNFFNWAKANGYSQGLEIDRINPALGYSPSNCQWLTKADNVIKMHKDKAA